MKWLIFLFLLLLLAPYGPQLRTRYTPLPLARRPRVWGVRGQHWAIAVVRFP